MRLGSSFLSTNLQRHSGHLRTSFFYNFSSSSFSSVHEPPPPPPLEPTLDVPSFQSTLAKHAPSISKSLIHQGYYKTHTSYDILPRTIIQTMRQQSIQLRNQNRFEPSWSEKIDAVTNEATRFDKEGVFACEPDGGDYDTAPDLIVYMSVLLQTLPELLNLSQKEQQEKQQEDNEEFGLSMSSFNAKLAVTSPGGSIYPLHIDNPQGLTVGDTRKLTCILYLNPDYVDGDGGELRIYQNSDTYEDVTPDGGRMVLFWSDEIPHEVLPTAPSATENEDKANNNDEKNRYALTLWIPTDNHQAIHNPKSKFSTLGDEVFPSKRRI